MRILLLLTVPLFSACAGYNFHEVDSGRFYRSAQLPPSILEQVIEDYGIRTVINLRGKSLGKKWYEKELASCARLRVEHHDITMSSRRIPHRDELLRLLDLLRTSPRPILVHCRSGADRTGLAAALYVFEYMGYSKEEATKMLANRYGHYAFMKPSKRYFLKIYDGQDWAYEHYDPCQQQYLYYDTERFCKEAAPH